LLLKATIKQHKALDVRMAIGIGTIDYTSNKVTESNGVLSLIQGMFEGLKKLWEYKRLGLDLTRLYNYFTISGFICRQMDDHICRNNKKALENPDSNQKNWHLL
jgi:hypothetical protein